MQRSSRSKLAFKCGSVKCSFCQFCINSCASAWSWKPRSRCRSGWSKRWAWNWKRRWYEAVLVSTRRRRTSMLPAGKSTGQHLWVRQKMSIRGTCRANRMGSTPSTGLLEPIMNYGMTIGPSYSTLVLAKWSIAKCSTSSWPWVNISPTFKDETDLFSRCFEYPARACHIIPESQRWMFVTAHSFFNASCSAMRCKNWVPRFLSCLQNLDLTLRKGRVQHGLVIRRFTI